MKIVVLDGYTENPGDLSWDDLKALGDLTVYDRTAADQIVNRIGDAEAVYTNKTPISAETLAACPNLKFIGVLATGYNIVDVSSAKQYSHLRHRRCRPVCYRYAVGNLSPYRPS